MTVITSDWGVPAEIGYDAVGFPAQEGGHLGSIPAGGTSRAKPLVACTVMRRDGCTPAVEHSDHPDDPGMCIYCGESLAELAMRPPIKRIPLHFPVMTAGPQLAMAAAYAYGGMVAPDEFFPYG